MSCSQETAAKIDDLVVALVQKQYEKGEKSFKQSYGQAS